VNAVGVGIDVNAVVSIQSLTTAREWIVGDFVRVLMAEETHSERGRFTGYPNSPFGERRVDRSATSKIEDLGRLSPWSNDEMC
jgi:hypothetical protein